MQPPGIKTTIFFFEKFMAESSIRQSQVSQASKRKATFGLLTCEFLIHPGNCVRGNYTFSIKVLESL